MRVPWFLVAAAVLPCHSALAAPIHASASLIVLRDTATATAVDPVETQQLVLLSDSFLRSLPEPGGVAISRGALEVRRLGRSAVLALRVAAAGGDQALRLCQSVVKTALAGSARAGEAPISWLQSQTRQAQTDLDHQVQALYTFKKRNNLLALSLGDQLDIQRRAQIEMSTELLLCQARGKCDEATRGRFVVEIDAAKRQTLRLAALELEHSRLQRAVDASRRLLDSLRSRLSELRLAPHLQPELRVLDACKRAE